MDILHVIVVRRCLNEFLVERKHKPCIGGNSLYNINCRIRDYVGFTLTLPFNWPYENASGKFVWFNCNVANTGIKSVLGKNYHITGHPFTTIKIEIERELNILQNKKR